MTEPVKSVGIRIWHGNRVVEVVHVSGTSSATIGAAGGAANSGRIDIEVDPWAGLIVDHSIDGPPIAWREVEDR